MAEEYYYSVDEQQLGPVPESELHRLRESGVIHPTSLIWFEGADDWTPYETVFPPQGHEEGDLETCAYSGRKMLRSEMLRYGDQWIDPAVKESFVQKLAEDPSLLKEEEIFEFEADLSLWSIFRQGFAIIRSQWIEISLVTVAVWLPLYLLLDYFTYATSEEGSYTLSENYQRIDQALGFWFGSIVAVSVIFLSKERWYGGASLSTTESMKGGLEHYWILIGTKILVLLAVGIPIVLALLPIIVVDILAVQIVWGILVGIAAIFLLVRVSFTETLTVINGEGGTEAISASWQATQGRFWKTFGYQLAAAVPMVILVALPQFLLKIEFLNNFLVSAALSTSGSLAASLWYVVHSVMAIHFREIPGLETKSTENDLSPSDLRHTPQ